MSGQRVMVATMPCVSTDSVHHVLSSLLWFGQHQFPNTSYGEDYATGLALAVVFRIGRIYDELYLCRRWGGNSDAV